MEKAIYVLKTCVISGDILDQYFEFQEAFGHIDDTTDYIEFSDGVSVDAAPVRIDGLVDMLKKMKRKGSEYVQITFCEEHGGYHIDGIKAEALTEDQAMKFIKDHEEADPDDDDDFSDLGGEMGIGDDPVSPNIGPAGKIA